jgi:hypothetical protein
MSLEFKEINNGELSRKYIFSNGEVEIKNAVRIAVRPSGSHRVETTNNEKYIVASNWLAIKIEADQWSF